jgi:plasmid stabilization system protein ParE
MVPELRDPAIRELFVGPFRLIYKLTVDDAQILAFIHGARDFPATWRREQGGE